MTAPSSTSAFPAQSRPGPGRTPAVVFWLVAATFVVILNETIMLNAIPHLMADLKIDESAAQWLSTAFMLTMAAVIPVTGWFLQRVTTRTAFATAMGVFMTGTALSAMAPAFEVLLLGRIIQAGGTAVMMPLLMTTLMTVVAEQDRGRVMGNVTLAMSVAPALGPAVSGVLLSFGSWRLIFITVLPIAALVSYLGMRNLVNVGETKPGTIDWFSAGIAAVGFGGLVYGLSQFSADSVLEPALIVLASVVTIAVFVFRQISLQRRPSGPLLDLRTLQNPIFRKALILMALAFMAMLGAMMLLPLYLQQVRDLSALKTGLLVMPGGLAMGLLGPQVGKVFDRLGGRPLVIPGSILIAVALFGFTQLSPTTPYALILGGHVLLMVGLAALFTPLFTLGLGDVPMHLYSHGSSILGTLQQVAGALGTAVVITLLSTRRDSLVEDGADPITGLMGGMHWGFWFGAVASLLVLILAFRLPGRLPQKDLPEPQDELDFGPPEELTVTSAS